MRRGRRIRRRPAEVGENFLYDPWAGHNEASCGFVAALLSVVLGSILIHFQFMSVVGFGLCVFGALSLVWVLPMRIGDFLSIRFERNLVRFGLLTMAEVISNETNTDSQGSKHHDVTFRFVTKDGEPIQTTMKSAPYPLYNYKPGHSFTLCYDPKRTSRFIPYESSCFEVDDESTVDPNRRLLRPARLKHSDDTLLTPASSTTINSETLLRTGDSGRDSEQFHHDLH